MNVVDIYSKKERFKRMKRNSSPKKIALKYGQNTWENSKMIPMTSKVKHFENPNLFIVLKIHDFTSKTHLENT